MGMGRQVFALLAGASASTFTKSVLAAVGVLLPVAAFGWFVIIAPAVVSLAVAVAAAMAWCAWLEKHPDTPIDVDRTTEDVVTSAPRAMLSVHVLATTHEGTRCALDLAKRLIAGLDTQVVLLLPRPAPLAAGFDLASQERNTLVDEHRALAADVGVHVKVLFCVCHRYDDVLLGRSSLLIVGGKTRTWWPTREERLVSRLSGAGYPVVFARVGAAHVLSRAVDRARS